MGPMVVVVVAAAWAAVLIPPLLRSRIENRPNSSVTDFRNQLSSLQRAMPSRGVSMRMMARPLAQSPLSRPAAAGRPALRSGVRTHGELPNRAGPGPAARAGRVEPARMYDASLRQRRHADRPAPEPRRRPHQPVAPASRAMTPREAAKRRRSNVLFVLALVAACALFLFATTRAEAMLYVFVLAFLALCGYVYVLGQMRQREAWDEPNEYDDVYEPAPARAQAPRVAAPARSSRVTRTHGATDRWSPAV